MSKVVIVNRQPHDDAILYINPIERMSKFKYLGSILKWDSDREVKIKAAMTKAILTWPYKSISCGDAPESQIMCYQMLYMDTVI